MSVENICYSSFLITGGSHEEIPWCFSQVKGTIEDEVADGKCRKGIDSYSSKLLIGKTFTPEDMGLEREFTFFFLSI